jgi:hypothetical protein
MAAQLVKEGALLFFRPVSRSMDAPNTDKSENQI